MLEEYALFTNKLPIMALAAELTSFYDKMQATAPPAISRKMSSAAKDHEASFDRKAAVQIGQALPEFSLSDGSGESWTKEQLLAKGPLLISFQRGGWCPMCNIELRSLQKYAHTIKERGVTLVAISPDSPTDSLSRRATMGLDFLLLSDPHNELAAKLGIVNKQPESLRQIMASSDATFQDSAKSLDVPVPATILVDETGIVKQTYVNPRYHERLEPSTALKWIEEMKK